MIRSSAVVLVAALTMAASAEAQTFEGTIALKATTAGQPEIALEMQVKGQRNVVITTLGPETGPLAGQQMRIINDAAKGEMVMLMPIPPGMPIPGAAGAKGMKVVMNLKEIEASAPKTPDPVITRLGTSQQVAGMQCDDYSVKVGNDTSYICSTEAIGAIALPIGPNGQQPAWSRALGNRPFFPLKVWGDGMTMEVTRVTRGSVPDSAFSYEGNYVDMTSMMGGMMRGGN